MRAASRGTAGAAARLLAVVAVLLLLSLWWRLQKAPDFHVDRALRLQPANAVEALGPLPLQYEVRDAVRVPVGQMARFHVVVPGGEARLSFHEAHIEGLPDFVVRLVRPDGGKVELLRSPASDGRWRRHEVPVPARPGEEVDLEIAVLEGRGRLGLGALLLADVVLHSEGRPVDETELPVVADAIVLDLLATVRSQMSRAPQTFESARVDMPGPLCLPVPSHAPAVLAAEAVPPGAWLRVVVTVCRSGAQEPRSPSRLVLLAGDAVLADLPVDEWARPGPEGEPPLGEVLVEVDLLHWTGRDLSLTAELTGGEGLFVGLREALVTAPRRTLRQTAGDEAGNVLLVLVDGLRADRLGAWGHERGHTPALDGLAARGLRYTHVVAPSAWGLPNVASLLTGVSPLVHGLGLRRERVLSPRLTTLAQAASWAGASTAAFTNSLAITPATGLHRGYEQVDVAALPAERLVERALAWLADAQQFRWFLTLHLSDPLPPHEPARQDLLAVATGPDDALVQRLRPLDSRPGAAEALAFEVGAAYDAELAGVDRALAILLDVLQQRGLLEHTLVVVAGTSGQEFYERGGRGTAQHLHDEVVRVPVILAGPRLGGGPRVETSLVALPDLHRLVGQIGRLQSTPSPEGLPPPFGPVEVGRFVHALLLPFPGIARTSVEATRRADLLRVLDRDSGTSSLFDLAADPGATVDLLAPGSPPAYRAEAAAMAEAFEHWYRDEILQSAARPVRWAP